MISTLSITGERDTDQVKSIFETAQQEETRRTNRNNQY